MNHKDKSDTSNETTSTRTNSLSYAASRLGPSMELIDIAKEIAHADAIVNLRVSAKLKVIADQIRHLQQEARDILEQTQHDQQLHKAECQFKRIPGKTYHLYEKNNQQKYFSMLTPEEWGSHPPHTFLGSYRLENDMSWTAIDESTISTTDDSRKIVDRLLNNIIEE